MDGEREREVEDREVGFDCLYGMPCNDDRGFGLGLGVLRVELSRSERRQQCLV